MKICIMLYVADLNPVVSINVHVSATIENGPPVVSFMQQLKRVRRIIAQCLAGDVRKNGSRGSALRLIKPLPFPQTKRCGLGRNPFPLHIPMPQTLLAIETLTRPD